MTQRSNTADFIKKSRKVHGDTYDYTQVEYHTAKTKVIVRCKLHGSFEITPDKHLGGGGCPSCAKESRKNFGRRVRPKSPTLTTEEFIRKAKAVHGNRYDYTKTFYRRTNHKITITCQEHGDFSITPNAHLSSNRGCPECGRLEKSRKLTKTTDSFIARAQQVHGDVYDYAKTVYCGVQTPVIITCPTHGDFEQTPSRHLYSRHGCPKCGCYISRGERLIIKLLTSWNVNFTTQHTFENLVGDHRSLYYDFYVPDANLLIEYDGEHHFRPVNIHGKLTNEQIAQTYERTVRYDHIKTMFAEEHKTDLLRIPYTASADTIEDTLYNRLFQWSATDNFGAIRHHISASGNCDD